MKSQPRKWEKMFANYTFDMAILSKICKKDFHLNNRKKIQLNKRLTN